MRNLNLDGNVCLSDDKNAAFILRRAQAQNELCAKTKQNRFSLFFCKQCISPTPNGFGCGDEAYNTIRMEHWKRVSGILCDRRISLGVKGKYTRQLQDQQ